tara:strand:- start:509 stop:1213 length:705 start_codon:yes stop_codon:yes gene_type:complete
MNHIIAIGGGELKDSKTLSIDKKIVKLTGKKSPKALIIPTAGEDSKTYFRDFKKIYGGKLKCQVDVLYLINSKLTKKEIKEKILSSDLIYVSGGSPYVLRRVWKKKGVDKILREAEKKDIILSGWSSGAICWAKRGLGSKKVRVYKGFGFIDLNFVCHYSKKFKKVVFRGLKKLNMSAVALEDSSAIEIVGKKYRILTSSKNARAYKLYMDKGEVVEKKLPLDGKFRSMKELSS